MITTKPWSETRDQVLSDRATAIEYLNQALNDPEHGWFLLALRHVAEANGGVAAIAEKTGLAHASLAKALSGKRDAKWSTIRAVLGAPLVGDDPVTRTIANRLKTLVGPVGFEPTTKGL